MGDRIFMSASEGIGLEELCGMIASKLYGDLISCELLIPYTDTAADHFVTVHAEVEHKEYTPEGVRVSCRIGRRYLKRIKDHIIL